MDKTPPLSQDEYRAEYHYLLQKCTPALALLRPVHTYTSARRRMLWDRRVGGLTSVDRRNVARRSTFPKRLSGRPTGHKTFPSKQNPPFLRAVDQGASIGISTIHIWHPPWFTQMREVSVAGVRDWFFEERRQERLNAKAAVRLSRHGFRVSRPLLDHRRGVLAGVRSLRR